MNESPLKGPPPAEIPLENAPLIRVIAQVRFPLIASIDHSEFIGDFQEAIRGHFPILRQETRSHVIMGFGEEPRTQTFWKFSQKSGGWSCTLTRDFLALETESYTSRANFLELLKLLIDALIEHINPALIDRIGLRYIDRIEVKHSKDLIPLVRKEVAGVLSSAFGESATVSVSENIFNLVEENGQVRARWGVLAPNTTIDPTAIAPVPYSCWVLDIDVFTTGKPEPQTKEILETAESFAKRAYAIFRWAVSDAFLKRYGRKDG